MQEPPVYHCDQCTKRIDNLYGPLIVSVRSQTEPQVNADKDFCSFNCLSEWATQVGVDA